MNFIFNTSQVSSIKRKFDLKNKQIELNTKKRADVFGNKDLVLLIFEFVSFGDRLKFKFLIV